MGKPVWNLRMREKRKGIPNDTNSTLFVKFLRSTIVAKATNENNTGKPQEITPKENIAINIVDKDKRIISCMNKFIIMDFLFTNIMTVNMSKTMSL